MHPQPLSFLLFSLIFCCALSVTTAGCTKTIKPPDNSPGTTDSTISSPPTTTVVDSAVMVYVGRSESLYAVDGRTGKKKWSVYLGDIIFTSPLYYQDMIYVVAGYTKNPTLYAFDENGKQQWTVTLDNNHLGIGFQQLIAANGLVYATTEFTTVTAYDAKSGAQRWVFRPSGYNDVM